MTVRRMSAQQPRFFGLFRAFARQECRETGANREGLRTPKAEVTRSNRVGCAT